jgi:SNF2 family DNA or RNA helicase
VTDLSSALVSNTVCVEVELPGQSGTTLETFVDFFSDLFEPLGWTDVDGKYYGSPRLETEKSSERRRKRSTARTQKQTESLEESFSSPDEKQPQGELLSSLWDFIYPILQPPLDLDSADPVSLPYPLWGFQKPGVEFLFERNCALLGDEMGTGKTVMASVAIRLLFRSAQVSSALVVCPVSVLRVWDRHLVEWAPELSTQIVHGQRAMRKSDWSKRAHVYITTYDTLRSDIYGGNLPKGYEEKFGLVVADEIQYIKNSTSKRSQALRQLKPHRRWGLSGTPMENKPEDVISIFRFLKPGLMRSEDEPPEIRLKMARYFLRRRKKDVLPDLPPKKRDHIWLDLDRAQLEAYRSLEGQIRSEFISRQRQGNEISRIHIFSAIQKLKQICNFAPGRWRSPKTTALLDTVENVAESGAKVVIFSQYVQEGVAKLEEILKPYGIAKIVGSQSRTQRDAEIDRFKSNPDIHVMLITIHSGGVGLTLTEASYVVHFDHWWNPALKWQAEDRVHRKGQEADQVNIYEYWMRDTIDQRIWDILSKKELLFETLVDSLSVEAIEQRISEEEWLEVLLGDTMDKSVRSQDRERKVRGHNSLGEVLKTLQAMNPFDFEDFIEKLLLHLGYQHAQVTKRSGDGGIDVVASRNTLYGPERVAVECKRYRDKVGVKVVRELAGVVAATPDINKGILVTTGSLTPRARSFCAGYNEIEVIEGLQLAKYVRDFGLL